MKEPARRRPFTEEEIQSLAAFAQAEAIDVVYDVLEGLRDALAGFPERCTTNPKIQQRIRDELVLLTSSIAAAAKRKAKELTR